MFAIPELAPIDYRLRHVKPNALSSEVLTPIAEPRVTQPSVAIYAYPLPNVDGEYIIQQVPNKILDRWCENFKANWVPSPGTDAQFMFDVYKKFYKDTGEVDPRFQNKPSIFPRSYRYELDCLKSNRMRLLNVKMQMEDSLESKPDCDCLDLQSNVNQNYQSLRWQDQPKLFAKSQTDPCIRRTEFALVGQPFMNEACNFYYENYPTPKFTFRPEKFA